jgi:hypothetical protein
LEDNEILEELVKALQAEGGEATLDRLLYAYPRLKETGREKVLEAAEKSGMIEVFEKTWYVFQPNLHRYILLRLAGEATSLDLMAKNGQSILGEAEKAGEASLQGCRRRSRDE